MVVHLVSLDSFAWKLVSTSYQIELSRMIKTKWHFVTLTLRSVQQFNRNHILDIR